MCSIEQTRKKEKKESTNNMRSERITFRFSCYFILTFRLEMKCNDTLFIQRNHEVKHLK